MHASYQDPDDAVLYDGCERCGEQAANPLALDNERLGRLWRRMVAVEKDDGDHYRTEAEAAAGRWLYRVAVLVERTHPAVVPWSWPWQVPGDYTMTEAPA